MNKFMSIQYTVIDYVRDIWHFIHLILARDRNILEFTFDGSVAILHTR